ncbi:hypothetical protein L195_g042350, partial [Trifolium pratense]
TEFDDYSRYFDVDGRTKRKVHVQRVELEADFVSGAVKQCGWLVAVIKLGMQGYTTLLILFVESGVLDETCILVYHYDVLFVLHLVPQ